MNDYLKLKKRDILRIGIKDYDGKAKLDNKGNEVYIEFDLEDINLPDNYNKAYKLVQKAMNTLRDTITITNKKEDVASNGIMTKNQELKMQALKKFYRESEEAMNLFLGPNGVDKIFGKTRYLTMYDDLAEMLEPIIPKIKMNVTNIEKQIKAKYSNKEDNVLRNE